ncbi:XkdQ/YqbQ family protein [Levilactobacillus wangkuiensis]|uniref:XkdQ/YqbQ family protein n=1 Tax=Levilactobacillus wangkuiensis TaxID=2799566 RepID=UPI0019440252|nr:late control protein D [Levilactobacillus wangkuiensis]
MAVTFFQSQTPGSKTKWDLREILKTDIKWTTDIDFSAGQLTFGLVEVDEGYTPKNGDVIWFNWDHDHVFKGKVFKVDYDESEVFSVTAYDSLRYFKNQDSLIWPVSTISQRFTKVAKLAGVKHKVVDKSTHKLVAEVADSKSYFDMLKASFKSTRLATGHRYFLHDNYGTVELRRSPYKKLKNIIGDRSQLTGFSLSKSIDEAANVVRVVRTDKKKKQKSSSTAKAKKQTAAQKKAADVANTRLKTVTAAGNSVDRWGKLQIVEKAKDKANAAQMKQKAKDILKSKNKQTYTLKLTTLATLSMVPGNEALVKVKSLKDIGLGSKYLLITKATHTFGTTSHTAELEMKVRI